MRIAQVAPPIKPVPPILYGTTERLISYLTEELVRKGHHVALFASGESETGAELFSVTRHSSHLSPECPEKRQPHTKLFMNGSCRRLPHDRPAALFHAIRNFGGMPLRF